mgnify:CR=1 FL=1
MTEPKAQLRIFLLGNNAVDLEHISLFPVDTWKGRKGGLRKDLMEALADMKPGCFRFPGGCIVEGTDLDTRYNWKNTLGPAITNPLEVRIVFDFSILSVVAKSFPTRITF